MIKQTSISALSLAVVISATLIGAAPASAQQCSSQTVGKAVLAGCASQNGNQLSLSEPFEISGIKINPGSAAISLDRNTGKVLSVAQDATASWGGAQLSSSVSSLDFGAKDQTVTIADFKPILAQEDFFTDLSSLAPSKLNLQINADTSTVTGAFDMNYLKEKVKQNLGGIASTLIDLVPINADSGVRLSAAASNSSSSVGKVQPGTFSLKFDSTKISLSGSVLGFDPSKSVLALLPVGSAELRKVNDFGVEQWKLSGYLNPKLLAGAAASSDGIYADLYWGNTLLAGPRGVNFDVKNIPLLSTLGLTSLAGLPFDITDVGAGVRLVPFGLRGKLGGVLGPTVPVLGPLGLHGTAEVGIGSFTDSECQADSILNGSLRGELDFQVPTPILSNAVKFDGVACLGLQQASYGPIQVVTTAQESAAVKQQLGRVRLIGKGDLTVLGASLVQAKIVGEIESDKSFGVKATGQAALLGVGGQVEARLNNLGSSGVCVAPTPLIGFLPSFGLAEEPGNLKPHLISCGKDSVWAKAPALPSQRSATTAQRFQVAVGQSGSLVKITALLAKKENISVTLGSGKKYAAAQMIAGNTVGAPTLIAIPGGHEFAVLLPASAAGSAVVSVSGVTASGVSVSHT
ncbi:hypothetical protein [Psychromicrobium lacuslunae]|uniref:Uncharacterized protein n=1 Tax=Psychromicrobium lacuslunae TaxID=1618207 RepID=A0A0D4C1N2_9MICC|nr:hypothetical protein [Psychromicrobium lacuslunae]AJT42488.1 hypothetical protein UM93_15100 [Psychromicrobium lacuslunae]